MIIIQDTDGRGTRRRRSGAIRSSNPLTTMDDFVVEQFIEDWTKRKAKDEEDKKKKEEKDKQAKQGRNFTALEWFLLLLLMYPIIGPYYLHLIKTISN